MGEKTLFLTGATGFVGSHVARKFLAEGWTVRALVRRPESPGCLPAGCEVVAAYLAEPGKYQRALEGCAAIVHAAGRVTARTLEDYRRANVSGTESVARAAASAAPRATFVLISSQSAAGPAVNGRPVEENDVPHPVSWYGKSKLEGEKVVEATFPGPRLIVRPCIVYGPGDAGLLQIFSIVSRGIAPILAGGRGTIQLIHATDLADVIYAAALRPDLSGRHGFAAGETVTTEDFVRQIASLRKRKPLFLPVPTPFIRLAGMLESARESLARRSRPFNRDKVKEILQKEWTCDPAPFLTDLHISKLKPWKEGVYETARWYVGRGWLPASFLEL